MGDIAAADVVQPGRVMASLITSPSLFFRAARTRAILAAAVSPQSRALCRTSAASGGAGRSSQIESIGLVSTAINSPPAFAQACESRATASGVCSQGS